MHSFFRLNAYKFSPRKQPLFFANGNGCSAVGILVFIPSHTSDEKGLQTILMERSAGDFLRQEEVGKIEIFIRKRAMLPTAHSGEQAFGSI